MKIEVFEIPNCTWVLEGDTFYCSHDETEIVEYENLSMDLLGNVHDHPSRGYVCAECGEELEGFPDERDE